MVAHGLTLCIVPGVHRYVNMPPSLSALSRTTPLSCSHVRSSPVAPGGTLWGVAASVNFALAYWSTSIAINIMLTLAIVTFLLRMRVKVRRAMGSLHHSTSYLSISAILIDSAFLYSAVGAVLPRTARDEQ